MTSIYDANNLQSDLNRLVDWYSANGFSMNISKYVHVSLHRHQYLVDFKCVCNEEIIRRWIFLGIDFFKEPNVTIYI